MQGREAILRVHLKGKRVADFDLSRFSRAIAGMTGADIMGLVNEAGIMAVRQGRSEITETDLFNVRLLVTLTMRTNSVYKQLGQSL